MFTGKNYMGMPAFIEAKLGLKLSDLLWIVGEYIIPMLKMPMWI